jgi:hypothetical protein
MMLKNIFFLPRLKTIFIPRSLKTKQKNRTSPPKWPNQKNFFFVKS